MTISCKLAQTLALFTDYCIDIHNDVDENAYGTDRGRRSVAFSFSNHFCGTTIRGSNE